VGGTCDGIVECVRGVEQSAFAVIHSHVEHTRFYTFNDLLCTRKNALIA
jgi:hypothetical protein